MAVYKNIPTVLSKPWTQEAYCAVILAPICTLRHTQNYTTIASISKIPTQHIIFKKSKKFYMT